MYAGDRKHEHMAMFSAGAARPADNHTAIIEFRVDDVDREYQNSDRRQRGGPGATSMPWGKSLLALRDPDGNLINFFTPVSRKLARNTLCEVIGEMLALHLVTLSIHIESQGTDGCADVFHVGRSHSLASRAQLLPGAPS